MMIDKCLEQLGFDVREVATFIALIEQGELTASEVSEHCAMPRSTAYAVLDGLVEKGVLATDSRGATTTYKVSSPSALLNIVQREKDELVAREKSVKQLIELVSPALNNVITGVPKLQFFSGKKGIEQMLSDNYKSWRESAKKHDFTWWGYQDDALLGQYTKWFHQVWDTHHADERVFLFSNQSDNEGDPRGLTPGRKVRRAPAEFHFSSTVWIVGDYIVMIATNEKPHHALQMNDAPFAENLRKVFRWLWQLT